MTNPNEDKQIDTSEYDKRLMGNVVRLPMEVNRARGSHIYDCVSRKHLLDFWGDEGVCSLGYNTPEYERAVFHFKEQGIPHQLPDVYPNKARWSAAEVICNRTQMDRIFFCNSGTEANEAAIKIARKYHWDKEFPKNTAQTAARHVVLTMAGNFHGRTGLSMAAGDPRVSPYHRHGFGPSPKGFGVINYDEIVDEFFLEVTDGLATAGPPMVRAWDKVAAVILAPVLGNNLVKTYGKKFWNALAEVQKNGVLIIFDDVQAGSGRCGHYSTWQHPEIAPFLKPDIIALGKGMAMGHPMSAMLASNKVAESFTPGVHFNTFGGSPFACHMAESYFTWLSNNLEDVRRKGERIRQALSLFGEVDGWGMLNAFRPDFEKYGYSGYQFCHKARDFGLSIVTHREFGPIRFTPPMNVKEEDLAYAFEALGLTHQALVK